MISAGWEALKLTTCLVLNENAAGYTHAFMGRDPAGLVEVIR